MTTDEQHTMLTLAAKAAGIDDFYFYYDTEHYGIATKTGSIWNPITSSADCSELEAKLMIDVYWLRDQVSAERFDVAERSEYYEHHNGDRQAAREGCGDLHKPKIHGVATHQNLLC